MDTPGLELPPSEDAPAPVSAAATESQPAWRDLLRFVWDVVETIVLALLLLWGINTVSARVRVDGYSMEPTLQNGEFLIVNRLAYKLGDPERGDVIVFRFPRNPDEEYIKRIIGLPGDHIKIAGGKVEINGKIIDEPYIAAAPNYQSDWTVPDDTLYVLGDNRNNSQDSHSWGPVHMSYVVGKALVIYWPPGQWGLILHPVLASQAP